MAVAACGADVDTVEKLEDAVRLLGHPVAFAMHAGQHLLLNNNDIFQEMRAATASYKTKDYENFGLNLGMALDKVLIGHEVSLDSKTRSALIVKGLVDSFFAEDPAMRACVQESNVFLDDVKDVMGDVEMKESIEGTLNTLTALSTALDQIPPVVAACNSSGKATAHDLTAALFQLRHPGHLVLNAGKELVVNHHSIFKDLKAAMDSWMDDDYEGFGNHTGDLLKTLTTTECPQGLVAVCNEEPCDGTNNRTIAPEAFVTKARCRCARCDVTCEVVPGAQTRKNPWKHVTGRDCRCSKGFTLAGSNATACRGRGPGKRFFKSKLAAHRGCFCGNSKD